MDAVVRKGLAEYFSILRMIFCATFFPWSFLVIISQDYISRGANLTHSCRMVDFRSKNQSLYQTCMIVWILKRIYLNISLHLGNFWGLTEAGLLLSTRRLWLGLVACLPRHWGSRWHQTWERELFREMRPAWAQEMFQRREAILQFLDHFLKQETCRCFTHGIFVKENRPGNYVNRPVLCRSINVLRSWLYLTIAPKVSCEREDLRDWCTTGDHP